MQPHPTHGNLPFQSIGRVIRDLAIIAGHETLKYHNTQSLTVNAKTDGSPVSEADIAANTIILTGLRKTFPHIPIITEEDGSDTPSDLASPFFLIDPLDGTKEFIRGSGDFTVNIALIIDHKPILGVVYTPAHNRLQWMPDVGKAVEESAPFDVETLGTQTLLQCRPANNQDLVAMISRSHCSTSTQSYLEQFSIQSAIRAGSSLKFCHIASGDADIYPRLAPTMEWDTAAAHAILKAAGGRILHAYTGEDLIYGKTDLKNPHFIAIGKNVTLPPFPNQA